MNLAYDTEKVAQGGNRELGKKVVMEDTGKVTKLTLRPLLRY